MIYLVNSIIYLSNNVGQINYYPVDSVDCFVNTCPLDWARTSECHLHFSVMNVTATSFTQIKQVWLLIDEILMYLNLDQDQKNIIDKLANFVARNGSKFEEMTKEKQKGNPKFAFLFSGEFYNYYRWKVSFEIGKTLSGYNWKYLPAFQLIGYVLP